MPEDAKEFGVDPNKWFAKVDLDLTAVTSINVDKENQQIDCSATVEATASGVDGKDAAPVAYKVQTDLSSGKIMVSADTSSGSEAIRSMAVRVGQPELVEPLKKRAQASKAKIAAIEAEDRERAEAYYRANPNSIWKPNNIPSTSTSNGVSKGDCSIEVGGTKYLDIKNNCTIDRSTANQVTINTGDGPANYFAYIDMSGDTASIYWNSKEKWNKGEEGLGDDFRKIGKCWSNKLAQICYSE